MNKAVFAIIRDGDKIVASTRPDDIKVSIGLPGGKVDSGESLTQALIRECLEEGIRLVNPRFTEANYDTIEGFEVTWFEVDCEYTLLDEYKEKHRGIEAILVDPSVIASAGYGNDFIK